MLWPVPVGVERSLKLMIAGMASSMPALEFDEVDEVLGFHRR